MATDTRPFLGAESHSKDADDSFGDGFYSGPAPVSDNSGHPEQSIPIGTQQDSPIGTKQSIESQGQGPAALVCHGRTNIKAAGSLEQDDTKRSVQSECQETTGLLVYRESMTKTDYATQNVVMRGDRKNRQNLCGDDKCGHCTYKYLLAPLIITLIFIFISVILMIVSLTVKQPLENWIPNNGTMELLPNDTILAYQGVSSSLLFTAKNESIADTSYSVKLYSTGCQTLQSHKKHMQFSKTPLVYQSYAPTPRPTDYLHYEVGSIFNYTLLDIEPESNIIELFVFNNEEIEEKYKNNPSNPSLQRKAVYQKNITNNSRHAVFEPSVAGNYIVTFVGVHGTVAYMAYSVTQVYYSVPDNADIRCNLNPSNSSCQIDLSHIDCVLANSSLNSPVTILSQYNLNTKHVRPSYLSTMFVVSLIFLLLCFIIFIPILVIVIKFRRNIFSG